MTRTQKGRGMRIMFHYPITPIYTLLYYSSFHLIFHYPTVGITCFGKKVPGREESSQHLPVDCKVGPSCRRFPSLRQILQYPRRLPLPLPLALIFYLHSSFTLYVFCRALMPSFLVCPYLAKKARPRLAFFCVPSFSSQMHSRYFQ